MTAVPEPSPEATPGSPVVTVMLVSRFGGKAGCDTLAALADSTLRPDRIVIVDLGTAVGARDEVLNHPALGEQLPTAIVHRERIGIGTAQALNQAVAALPAAPGRQDLASVEGSAAEPTAEHPDGLGRPTPAVGPEWLWFLTEDSRPEPDALRLLVDAVRRSPSVGMAGTKVLDAANPRHLLDVGLQITRSGRRIAAPQRGEPDQGQYDTRTDVLAVTLPGMLVRRVVFERIGGFECALPAEGRPLDLGWRAQLAGARVIVVPAARIYVPDGVDDPMTGSTAGKLAHLRAQRSAARRVCLARCSPWLAPLLAIWIVLTSVTSALAMLMLKRPAHAWVELGDLSAVVHPISSVVARWRFRTRRGLRRRDLATVFVTSAEALRHTVDRVHDALTPGGDRSSDGATASMGALEAGPVAEEAEDLHVLSASLPERIATNPGVLAVVTAGVAAAIGFRSTLRGGLLDAQGAGLAGGELQPLIADASGLWHAWRDAWRGAGFGTSAETGPWLAVLSGITWLAERIPLVSEGGSPAAVVLAWVLVLGLPLATAAAYVAAKTLRAARWPRALAALAWGCSGVAVSAA